MGWEGTIDLYGTAIQDRLKDYLAGAVEEAGGYHPFIAQVYSDLEEFVLRRGKRLASCSALLTYKGYTGDVDDRILRVCVGIELYRHCLLVHDDLIDMDDLRRGGRTLHRPFMEKYDARFGEGAAVFVGNIAYALAVLAIARSGFPAEKVERALQLLSIGYQEVNESQILDLLFEYKEVDIDEWQVMVSKRAASLFKTTMLIGATLGGASKNELRILERAAANIGYSFDIQDDIIDTYADEEQYGRPPCGDIALAMKPLHVIHALKSTDCERSIRLKELMGKKRLNRVEIDRVRTLIRESGGLEAAKKTSRNHAEEARALIAQTSLQEEVKGFFDSLIAYLEQSLDWYK